MNLSKQQTEIVETTASEVVVIASAASGKTAVLVERVKFLLDAGYDPKKIVLITFTNAAAEELAERLDHPKGLFIGTIHSYANYLLLANGTDTHDLLENEQFDRLFNRIKHNPDCIKEVEHLLLDESQDSNEAHFEFLLDMVKPTNYMIMGDHKQSIYRWNGAFPDYIINLSKRPGVTTYELDENYRNATSILTFAKNIIMTAGYDYRDTSKPMRGITGKVVQDIEYSPHAIAKTFAQMKDGFGEWFIIARKNEQIDEIASALKCCGVPYDTFKRAELDNKELNKKMKENTVKVLTIHASKGLEANNVIVVGAKFFNIEEKCISYVAATRARNALYWTKAPNKRKPTYGMSNWEK
jgi:superfamily I DNA/RNA helicase